MITISDFTLSDFIDLLLGGYIAGFSAAILPAVFVAGVRLISTR